MTPNENDEPLTVKRVEFSYGRLCTTPELIAMGLIERVMSDTELTRDDKSRVAFWIKRKWGGSLI